MREPLRIVAAAIAVVAIQGCAAITPSCGAGLMPMTQVQLFFGRDIEHRATVSDQQWRDFIDQEVTPRFPEGFSVSDVTGQYRDQSRTIVREPSKLVQIVLPGGPDDLGNLQAVAEAYKKRFRQQSVGIIARDACVSF